MTSTDFHLRHLIRQAAEHRSLRLVDDAFSVIEANFDRFGGDFAPELLVVFAEVASELREREPQAARAVELFDRLRCEDEQFRGRALLVRCVCEARLGSEASRLKGMHLLQQLKYALGFLTQALAIATKPGNDARYGFLVYNASLVFWEVVRPICRRGWQRHVVQESVAMLEALKLVGKPGGAPDAKGKGAAVAGGSTGIPVTLELSSWLVELSLNIAFGLEDAEKNADAQKMVDFALAAVEDAKSPKLKALVFSAKAYLARKAPGKVKEDIDKASGSGILGAVLFVCNGGTPKEQAEDQLAIAWKTVDTQLDLKQAKEAGEAAGKMLEAPKPDKVTPTQLVELASASRAACSAGCWAIAQLMLARLEKFQIPAGRGRLLLDLSRAEVDVWQALNIKKEDPKTKFLLSHAEQRQREVDARHRAVRLCEQCIATAKRIDEIDIVEESAVVMWNLGRELACKEHRFRVHKSFQKCAEILEEIQSSSLVQLRVQLHFEVACCEIAQDLLTKGRQELQRASAIDYTIAQQDLPEVVQKVIAPEADPGPFLRNLDDPIGRQLHLLDWKLNVYEEPSDPADQVMLLLDQVRRQGASGKLAFSLLVQGFSKLEGALESVSAERLDAMSGAFVPARRVLASDAPLRPLPQEAPATARAGGGRAEEIAALVPQPIRDQRPKSEREVGEARAKRIVDLMCRIALEAHRLEEVAFSLQVCQRAVAAASVVSFGPPPTEVESALLLAEVDYARAQCLSQQLEELGVVNGVDDTVEAPEDDDADQVPDEEVQELTPEEKEKACRMKRELIASLLHGMDMSFKFKQWWMLANGLRHWWNSHLELVSLSHEQPQLLARTLPEYQDGLKEVQRYLQGEAALPKEELDHRLAADLALAHVNAGVANGHLAVLETEQLMVLRRLREQERKDIVAQVFTLCRRREKPPPDLARLRPERLEAAAPVGKPAKGAAPAPVPGADKSDLQGNEADIMAAITSIPFAKDSAEGVKLVEQALTFLTAWAPHHNDEGMLTLWVEFWTRLGRQCLGKPLHPSEGAKYALMCGIKGLGSVDAPTPKHASPERMRWRGACHALCGEVFEKLVDPQRQEKESLTKLRRMSVEQFERCCEYAAITSNLSLAAFGANSLWNVALPLMHSADTRQLLISPLLRATRALACVKYSEDPFFFVGLYRSLFECYSDTGRWDEIHEMLTEAFATVPPSHHRRLWALRMLALSRQGKNVLVAMGKMKESQAKAQAGIWLVLAGASSKQVDQFNAFMKATDILQDAEQPEVVEVRLQFADWLLRNGFDQSCALEQVAAAADMLLELEDGSEEEEEDDDEFVSDPYLAGLESSHAASDGDWNSQSDGKSFTGRSQRSSRRGGGSQVSPSEVSRRRSASGRSAAGRSRGGSKASRRSSRSSAVSGSRRHRSQSRGSRRSRQSSVASKQSRMKKAEEDEELTSQLYSRHYEALCRIFATRARLEQGDELHSSLLAASHFAMRFFVSTVDLANSCVQKLSAAAIEVPAAESAAAPGRASLSLRKPKRDDTEAASLPPSFVAPVHLVEWASEERWPWTAGGTLSEVIARAEQGELVDRATCTWAGHADAFPRQPLTFQTLLRLEDDLEEHGYHLHMLPVLALHLQLADALENEHVKAAVACLARMRLSRVAAACGLRSAAEAATERWSEALRQLPTTFSAFEDEREQVRSQRAGRGAADALEPEWLEVPGGSKRVRSPWSCSELKVYEVWSALGRECLRHGELWLATTLAEEAVKHATDYGDQRALRELLITQARLARAEGKDTKVIQSLAGVAAAEVEQLLEIADLLSDAYRRRGQAAQADLVLSDALRAAELVPAPAQACPRASVVRACSLLRCRQAVAEIHRLRAAPVPSQEWLADLEAAFAKQGELCAALQGSALHAARLRATVAFSQAVVELVEARQQELHRDPANAGVLTYGRLAQTASRVSEVLAACQPARDALLSHVVPLEGVHGEVSLPAELLAVQLDVWTARGLALRRQLTATVKAERLHALVGGGEAAGAGAIFSLSPNPGGSRSSSPQEKLDEAATLARSVELWLDEVDQEITAESQEKLVARAMTEAESSAGMLANAVTTLRHDPADGAMVATRIEALVELGRVQLELAAGMQPGSRWDPPKHDPYEFRGMEIAERYSNVLSDRSPSVLAGAEEHSHERASQVAADEVARATLCEAAAAAVAARRFAAAARAFRPLALEAYGLERPDATVEFLFWLQGVEVCARAEEFFGELLPEEHAERVQLQTLRELEETWPQPGALSAYRATLRRLQLESPLFQKLQLSELPPISELLLSNVPPGTLVVTLQIHDNFLYMGATCSPPPDPDPEARAAKLQHVTTRVAVREVELHSCIQKLSELNLLIEKELISSVEVDASFSAQYCDILRQVDTFLIKPLVTDLVSHFWQWGLGATHPSNPKQLLLLPDNFLWPLPLERFPSLLGLFAPPGHAAFARDFSLHLTAMRARTTPPCPRAVSTVLLTDPFNDDVLRPNEDPKSETMCAMHKRLIETKVVGGAEKSINGQTLTPSPQDIKGMLADCTMFLSLGFGRFFTAMQARHLLSQDLRHIKLFALFMRAQNDGAFRRQTKADSMKSIKQQAMENSYGTPLLAAFRGVQCSIQVGAPVPVNLNMRCLETFAKGIQAGKPVAKALEEVLALTTDDPARRYERTLEGGAIPGAAPVDPKKGAPPPAEGAEELLPEHTRTAYFVVGVAWQPSETEAPVTKKK